MLQTMTTNATSALPPGPRSGLFQGLRIALRRDMLGLLERTAREYGDIAYFKIGTQGVYLLNRPELIRDVLVTHNKKFAKGRGLERARRMLGNGLLTSEGEFHLRQRRLAQPAFHRQRIAAYAETMVAYAERAHARWHDGETRDVHEEMMRLTLAIVAKTLFDADVEGDADEIGHALSELIDLFDFSMLPFAELLERLPIPPKRRFDRARATLDRIVYRIIEDRRTSSEDRGDLLSMLLMATDTEGDGTGMTDEQLRDEAMTIFLAGHETTANALTWTFYLLAEHPEVEAKLHDELDRVLGGRAPTIADLPSLPYTERVLTESMRLYPPAWVLGRRALEDYEVEGYVIPAGSIVVLSQWLMHRDGRYFDEPLAFEPDRWTPEMKAALPRYAYFPFSAGPRNCVGEHFAWMEGELIVASVARLWRMRLAPGQRVALQPQITLRPRYGMRMELARR